MNAVMKNPGFALRPMNGDDVSMVVDIECAAYPHPWSKGIFDDCLRVGYCCWVIESAGEIVGHGIMSAAAGECHILNVCVHPHYQQRGLGRRLLRRLLSLGRTRNADTAFLEVRPSNPAAVALYESEGFSEVGIRRSYYPTGHGREDAIIMACPL